MLVSTLTDVWLELGGVSHLVALGLPEMQCLSIKPPHLLSAFCWYLMKIKTKTTKRLTHYFICYCVRTY